MTDQTSRETLSARLVATIDRAISEATRMPCDNTIRRSTAQDDCRACRLLDTLRQLKREAADALKASPSPSSEEKNPALPGTPGQVESDAMRLQPRRGNHYGQPLETKFEGGALVIRIGVRTLAWAVTYADWANPYDEDAKDYVRTFAIENADYFAQDVRHAMLREREDGSTPLSEFIDRMSQEAIEDGSAGIFEESVKIGFERTHPCEAWAQSFDEAQPASNVVAEDLPADSDPAIGAEVKASPSRRGIDSEQREE